MAMPGREKRSDWAGPLIIVGPSRSGSVLLREILNHLPGVHLFNETHYFEDFRPKIPILLKTETPEAVVASCKFYHDELVRREYAALHQSAVTRSNSTPSNGRSHTTAQKAQTDVIDACDHIFEEHCRRYAEHHGSRIWGEKTPRHIYRIDEILAIFPQAKFLCMLRDSRAVVASYRDWSRISSQERVAIQTGASPHLVAEKRRRADSYHPLISAALWRSAVNAGMRATKRHGEGVVRFVQFEALVTKPEQTIRDIAAWLDIPFDISCLNVPMQNSSVAPADAATGISTAPIERWRSTLSQAEIKVVEFTTGVQLESFGYQRQSAGLLPSLPVIWAAMSLPIAAVRAARANRTRFSSLGDFIGRRLKDLL